MKRAMLIMTMMFAIAMSVNAMGYREASIEARYLTDKMSYELRLSPREYDRVYRANLKYLLGLNSYDDVYSRGWSTRNSALQIILGGKRWGIYIGRDYFYRPVSWHSGAFVHNIYNHYPRHKGNGYYGESRKYKEHKMNYGQFKKQFKDNGKKRGHGWKD